MLYLLYRLGEILINPLPIKVAYWLVVRIADIKYFFSVKDKRILRNNLRGVFGDNDSRINEYTRGIFRNFCKYLVDFLRADKIDNAYIKKFVKIKGSENVEEALKKGNGVIMLSAHLGNWEMGAVATASLGHPLNIIALSHKDKRVNMLFDNRRMRMGAKIIPLGGSVKKALACLNKNELLAVMADRDFSRSSLVVKFFGKDTIVPRGVGIFNLKKGSPIVPTFAVREPDDTYTLTFEKPIEYKQIGNEAEDVKGIVEESLKRIGEYVKKYPDQWFMFADLWPKK